MFDFFKNLFGSESGTKRRKLSSWERKKILERQKNRCAMCGRKLKPEEYHFDHKKPLALGGKDDISNIQALCPNCHHIKTKGTDTELPKKRRRNQKSSWVLTCPNSNHHVLISTLTLIFLHLMIVQQKGDHPNGSPQRVQVRKRSQNEKRRNLGDLFGIMTGHCDYFLPFSIDAYSSSTSLTLLFVSQNSISFSTTVVR